MRPQSLHNLIRHPWIVWVLLVVCLALFKWPYLDLPYYWDEMGVYANGAIDMAMRKSVSLMPEALHPELSRGHPLLAYAVFALSYQWFGISPVVGHVTALLIAVLLLAVVLGYTRSFWGNGAAVLALVFLAVQPLFIAQSGLVLPEMLLGLFCLLALWSYTRHHHGFFALFASLALLTKETAIVLPVMAIAASLSYRLLHKEPIGWLSFKWFWWLVPLLVYVGFLLIQKQQHGWYFFGVHTDSINLHPQKIAHKLYYYTHFLVWQQGRYWVGIVGFLLLVHAGLTGGRFGLSWLLDSLRRVSWAAWVIAFYLLGIVSFSSLNFDMNRYMLPALVVMAVPVGVMLNQVCSQKLAVRLALVVALVANCCLFLWPNRFTYDVDMSYVDEVKVLQKGVQWFERNIPEGSLVRTHFPCWFATTNATLGYLSAPKNISYIGDDQTFLNTPGAYLMVMEPGSYENWAFSFEQLELVHADSLGYARFEVYRTPTATKP